LDDRKGVRLLDGGALLSPVVERLTNLHQRTRRIRDEELRCRLRIAERLHAKAEALMPHQLIPHEHRNIERDRHTGRLERGVVTVTPQGLDQTGDLLSVVVETQGGHASHCAIFRSDPHASISSTPMSELYSISLLTLEPQFFL